MENKIKNFEEFVNESFDGKIRVTFRHYRNVFEKTSEGVFKKEFMEINFPNAEFEGFEYGYNYPSFLVSTYSLDGLKKNEMPIKIEVLK